MKVFFDGTKPTPFRSAALGVEVTLSPGVNEIDDEELADEIVVRGAAKPVSDVNPNISSAAKVDEGGRRLAASPKDGGNHEPQYAPENQGIKLDIESRKKSGAADPGAIQAAQSANRALDEAEAEQARKDELAAGIPEKDGVHHPKVRPTEIQGTEALSRRRLDGSERKQEALRRSGHAAEANRIAAESKSRASKKSAGRRRRE